MDGLPWFRDAFNVPPGGLGSILFYGGLGTSAHRVYRTTVSQPLTKPASARLPRRTRIAACLLRTLRRLCLDAGRTGKVAHGAFGRTTGYCGMAFALPFRHKHLRLAPTPGNTGTPRFLPTTPFLHAHRARTASSLPLPPYPPLPLISFWWTLLVFLEPLSFCYHGIITALPVIFFRTTP